MDRPALEALLCLVLVFSLLSAGCAGGAGNGSGQASRPPAPARGVQPDTIALMADNFTDTNANRYRDTTNVIVYLFADNHAIPISVPGTFSFELNMPDGRRIAEWRFDQERVAEALDEFGPGPGYYFELSLLNPDFGTGDDRIEETKADLVVVFTPAVAPRGEEVKSLRRRGTPLQIGPMGRRQ